MTRFDFVLRNVKYFKPYEILRTGASLSDVKVPLLVAYDKFRGILGRHVCLLPNGLTTGKHKDNAHRKGYAGDCSLREGDGPIVVPTIVAAALQSGFQAIGVYHNDTAYSFHLGIGHRYRFWSGFKKHGAKNWHYRGLIIDPKNFLNNP